MYVSFGLVISKVKLWLSLLVIDGHHVVIVMQLYGSNSIWYVQVCLTMLADDETGHQHVKVMMGNHS